MTKHLQTSSGLFPEREFELELVSGIVQPEANTYMLKAGAKQEMCIRDRKGDWRKAEELLKKDMDPRE